MNNQGDSMKAGDKVHVTRIGPDGKGIGTIREIGGPRTIACTIDFDVPKAVVDCFVKRGSNDDI